MGQKCIKMADFCEEKMKKVEFPKLFHLRPKQTKRKSKSDQKTTSDQMKNSATKLSLKRPIWSQMTKYGNTGWK